MINKDNSISSKIVVSCKREGDKTLLVDSYFDIPYKVVHYGSKLLHPHLEVMMMCYSPGVMDGDVLDIDVHCPERTEMKLFTQSFNKLHPMKKGAAQYTNVRVENDAIFQYLPQPMIPFKNAIFDTVNDIRIKGNGHLIWGDIISGGRIHSGEAFEFSHIHSTTKVYKNKKLVFFDNQLMQPKKQPLTDLLFFEGHTHQGTLLIVSSYASALKAELDELLSAQFTDMAYGFTQCGPEALLIRTLGESGDAIHEWLNNIGDMCWSFIRHHQQEQHQIEDEPKKTNVKKETIKTADPKTTKVVAKTTVAKSKVKKV